MAWLSPRAWFIAALASGALALAAPAAHAGQIVWTKGTDLWVMNDDGSGAHRLVAASQIPGATNVSQPSLDKTRSRPTGAWSTSSRWWEPTWTASRATAPPPGPALTSFRSGR